MRGGNLPQELCHFNAAVFGGKVVAIAPRGFLELRAIDDDLAQLNTRACLDLAGDNVDAGAEAKDEGGVLSVKHQVAASQEDLARCGDGGRGRARHSGLDCLL
ncbi:hypothetical protein RRF57_009883 [Xylaria bambusicola]|uniref:Uncharacterized protein n=1 Tax=Xylaria bambusicola TaxID=326684 RepID=A0AAN7V029_9PEZI